MWATRRSIEPGLEGVVASVNLNRGGVPKPPVDGTWVRTLGLDGDGHHNPDVHGGPTAAVCLYPQEAIERVRADGHQSFPGSYGENLTLLGIDWAALGDGDRLELGDPGGDEADGTLGPLLELTQYATPCATQAHWFVEGRIAPHQPQGPARGRPLVRARAARGPGPARHGRPGACARPERPDRRSPRSRRHALRFAPMHARIRRPRPDPPPGRKPPATREALLEQHAAARRRRNAAELGSHEWEQASGGGRPDRGRDRPHRAGDGPAQGLRGDRRQHPRRDPRSRPPIPPDPDARSRAAIVRPMDGVVLVLNQNYEPLNVCNIPRAFRLVFGSKAEVIEYDHAEIRTVRTVYQAPSVIRLQHQIRRPRPRVKLTRREIFSRDRHTCQYCGRAGERPHARPRGAPPSRRRPHVGEPRRRVQAVQPPQGRPDARGGARAPGARRRSSRAATSTRCSRRTSRTRGTRPGGRYLFLGRN